MDLSKSGKRIKEMRKKRGLTQTELASKLLGIDTDRGKSKISEYEHGKNLTLKNIQELAKALECDPDYLLGCINHPDITTSWIAEKIPLSREAIEALEALGYNLTEYSDYDSALVINIINDLIINLVQSIEAALEIDLSTLEGGEMFEGYDVKVMKSGVFTDAAEMLIAYESISDFQSGKPQHTTPVEYNYARLAISVLKANIGNRLSDIVAGTVRKYADPEKHIRTEV